MTDTVKITSKITKLLRLAEQRDSAEEAAVAYAQAQRLATLHGLNLSDVVLDAAESEQDVPLVVESIEQLTLDEWGKAVAWKVRLVSALAEANKCRSFYSSERVVAYGQPADLHVVAVLYRSISQQIDRLAKEAVRCYTGREGSRSYGRSFRLGAVSEVRRRLPRPADLVQEQEQEVNKRRELAVAADNTAALAESTTSLVRVCAAREHIDAVKSAVDAYAEERLNLKAARGFAGADVRGYHDGRRAARAVSIAKPAKGLR